MTYTSELKAELGTACSKGAVLLALCSLLETGSLLQDIRACDGSDGGNAHNDGSKSSENLHGDGFDDVCLITLGSCDAVQESSSRNSFRGKLDLKYSSRASVRRSVKLDHGAT